MKMLAYTVYTWRNYNICIPIPNKSVPYTMYDQTMCLYPKTKTYPCGIGMVFPLSFVIFQLFQPLMEMC